MRKTQRTGGLDVAQDEAFERREWLVERLAWVAIAGILLAALAGLFGSGPLSETRIDSSDGQLQVELHRFGRLQAPGTLLVRIGPEHTAGQELRVWLDPAYGRTVQVESVLPPPERVEVGTDRLTYVFPLSQPGKPIELTFHVIHQECGFVLGQAGVEGGPSVALWQFVYP